MKHYHVYKDCSMIGDRGRSMTRTKGRIRGGAGVLKGEIGGCGKMFKASAP